MHQKRAARLNASACRLRRGFDRRTGPPKPSARVSVDSRGAALERRLIGGIVLHERQLPALVSAVDQ